MGEKLRILEECRTIMREVFKLIKKCPEYRYTINDQLIRSALSIGSNIAEGNMRKGQDRKHFFDMALGSLEECRFQLSVYPNSETNLDDTFDKIRATVIRLQSPSPSQSQSSSELK